MAKRPRPETSRRRIETLDPTLDEIAHALFEPSNRRAREAANVREKQQKKEK